MTGKIDNTLLIKIRKDLRAWAKDKPKATRDQVGLLCEQLRVLSQAPHSKEVKRVVDRSMKRLKGR